MKYINGPATLLFICVWHVNCIFYSLVSEDNLGAQSPAVVLDIVACSGCNDQGTCNYTIPRPGTVVIGEFAVATCVCDEYYQGMINTP